MRLPKLKPLPLTPALSMLLAAILLCAAPAEAKRYPLPPAGSRLIGELEDYIIQQNEHLELVGKNTQIGFLALLEANPGVDPYLPKLGRGCNKNFLDIKWLNQISGSRLTMRRVLFALLGHPASTRH